MWSRTRHACSTYGSGFDPVYDMLVAHAGADQGGRARRGTEVHIYRDLHVYDIDTSPLIEIAGALDQTGIGQAKEKLAGC